MKNRKTYAISSYQELTEAKVKLKSKIEEQVFDIKNNKIVRFASFLTDGEKKDDSFDESLGSFDLMGLLNGPVVNLLSSFLIKNKSTRKYFIAFIIAKEMAPYLISKVNDIFFQSNSDTNK